MHPELLHYLACPICGGELRVSKGLHEDGQVIEGEITCQSCQARYAVRNGIPRMIAPLSGAENRSATDRVDLTVSQYSAYQGEVYAPLAECLQNEAILKARTGLESADYAGKVCLDAGCGIGRFSRVMARAGAKRVIALDAGDSIDAAKSQTDPTLPISFVQGHILELPLKKGCIDRAISIGVLHHTAHPENGFRSISKAVSETGSFSVYLYTRSYLPWHKFTKVPFWQLRIALWGEPIRKIVVRLPKNARLAFCKALYVIRMKLLEPLNRSGPLGSKLSSLLQIILPRDIFKPLENKDSNIARSFDAYSTPYNYNHELEELVDWFITEPGFQRLHVTPYRLSITGSKDPIIDPEAPVQITLHRAKSIAALEAEGVEHQPI